MGISSLIVFGSGLALVSAFKTRLRPGLSVVDTDCKVPLASPFQVHFYSPLTNMLRTLDQLWIDCQTIDSYTSYIFSYEENNVSPLHWCAQYI